MVMLAMMLPYMHTLRSAQFQIFQTVVAWVAIAMVHNLTRLQVTPQCTLHNQPMLKDVGNAAFLFARMRMPSRRKHSLISIWPRSPSAFAVRQSRATLRTPVPWSYLLDVCRS